MVLSGLCFSAPSPPFYDRKEGNCTMEQTKDVVTQIRTHYDSFSKSHRRLADFILENLHEVAFLSINELSQRTGISPATITRFARRLDFQGYPDLQRGLYEHQKQWAPFGQLKSLLRRETPAEDAGPDSLQWTIQNNRPAGGPVHPPAAGFLCPRPGDPASGPDHLYRRDAFLLCHGLLSGLHAPADV